VSSNINSFGSTPVGCGAGAVEKIGRELINCKSIV